MCRTLPPSFCPSCNLLYAFLIRWIKPLLTIFGGLLLLMLLGCSSANWAERTQIPSTPILASIRKVNLDGIDGVWMDSRDAGTLAQWINDVEQVKARY
nr:MAG TPA: hypothetical protein [Caudoviricetes sp.]